MKFTVKNKKVAQTTKGFTLIELMVAIFVLTVGILGVYGLATIDIGTVSVIKDRLIAANLAQEQIEVVRSIRDANWLNDRFWYTNISASDDLGINYADLNVNYNSVSLANLPDGLSVDSITNYYTHSASPNTRFLRHIEIEYFTDSDGYKYMQVKSVVSWTEKGRPYEITAEDHLYDWR